MPRRLIAVMLALICLPNSVNAQNIRTLTHVPLTKVQTQRPPLVPVIHSDRRVYWQDDGVAHFAALLLDKNFKGATATITLTHEGDAAPLPGGRKVPLQTGKLAMVVDISKLAAGRYTLNIDIAGPTPTKVQNIFTIAAQHRPAIAIPAAGIPIELMPQAHVADVAWPISTAVPFPHGTLADIDKLVLLEDGKPVPDAEFRELSTWEPKAAGVTTHVRWARLNFLARYKQGKPAAYAVTATPNPAAPGKKVVANEEGPTLTLDNGMIQVEISRESFAGVQRAWLDQNGDGKYSDSELVITGNDAGPYVVDEAGNVYFASGSSGTTVELEECSPARAVVRAEGWYINPKPTGATNRFCRFQTRITLAAGQPQIHVQHHTIVTFDTDKKQIRDLGFRVPTPAVSGWKTGVDGKVITGSGPSFVHQFRSDQLRLVAGDKTTQGSRADGYLTAELGPARPAVTVMLRDFWQKFPKEVEATADGVTLHFWPRHGINTFTAEETYSRANIYKLWFYHHGELLNLRFPQQAYDMLQDLDKKSQWGYQMGDVEGMSDTAMGTYGEGLSIGNDFAIRLHAPADPTIPGHAALFQQNPWARSDPAWNVATKVEGDLSAHDPAQFPELAADVDSFFLDYMNAIVDKGGQGGEYGMWIYANTHNHWDPVNKQAGLHRVWQAGHYRQTYTPWLLLFRGNDINTIRWARANTDHLYNIDTINWTDPSHPLHTPGSFYESKGFVPWGATRGGQKMKVDIGLAGITNHWISPDALLMAYLLDGNLRAWDVYQLWLESVRDVYQGGGNTREAINTFGEVLNYYNFTRDPEALIWTGVSAEQLVNNGSMTKFPEPYFHPIFHPQWFTRLYDLTRDPRITEAMKDWAQTYTGHADVNAFLYQRTGDKTYLQRNMEDVYDRVRQVYRNPGDPAHGFRDAFSASALRAYQTLPYWIAALRAAGITDLTPGRSNMIYPAAPARFNNGEVEPPSVEVLALQETDAPFTVRLESLSGRDVHAFSVTVIAPDGKILVQQTKDRSDGKIRFVGNDAHLIEIPADGQTGIYRILVRSHEVIFKAPYTNLPVEAASLLKDRQPIAIGKVEMYLAPMSADSFTLDFSATSLFYFSYTAYVRVADAAGKVLLESTVLAGSERPSVKLDIDPRTSPPPYHLYMASGHGPAMGWTGNAKGLILAPTAAHATRLATTPAAAAPGK